MTRVWIFTVIPIVTAALAILCAVLPATGRLIWVALAFAVLNIVLTPLASGEWFYQRAEEQAYDAAVTSGQFTTFDNLIARHDPHRPQRMIAVSVALLAALLMLALVRHRASKGNASKGNASKGNAPKGNAPKALSLAVSVTVVAVAVAAAVVVIR